MYSVYRFPHFLFRIMDGKKLQLIIKFNAEIIMEVFLIYEYYYHA
jgi:hypothetical protein